MGLHIVDSLVRKNGGRVSASNRPDGGAEFRILVPA
jgi:signal transduction histidine kinase